MSVIYNELDAYAARWLGNLSDAGHIARGVVDSRSIVEVQPHDVAQAVQFHSFAGIGVWSYALRLAGWPDDRPVWTGSCPCQPFSVAGRGRGVKYERHLWPEWLRLIRECRPPVIFGEQVASADGRVWLATVRADLEALGYAVGAADLCAAGIGAPHIRQRIYFGARLADSSEQRRLGRWAGEASDGRDSSRQQPERLCDAGARRLADAAATGRGVERPGGVLDGLGPTQRHDADGRGEVCRLGDTSSARAGRDTGAGAQAQGGAELRAVGDAPLASGAARGLGDTDDARPQGRGRPVGVDASQGRHASQRHGAKASPWSNPDWVYCVDRGGVWRPVEPGTSPLAHGAPARVGRLRAYGNAIVAQVAAAFVAAFIHSDGGRQDNRGH